MKINAVKNFYENKLKNPHKQITYSGYAALASAAVCLVKTKNRKIHKSFGFLTGVFSLLHFGLIKYSAFKATAKNRERTI